MQKIVISLLKNFLFARKNSYRSGCLVGLAQNCKYYIYTLTVVYQTFHIFEIVQKVEEVDNLYLILLFALEIEDHPMYNHH